MRTISLVEARNWILERQGLHSRSSGALATLEQLGYIQIDTISVVERAHHHVLWSRQPSYQPHDLGRLVDSGQAFEYWSHAASFLPMRDYRFSLPRKRLYTTGEAHWFTITAEHKRWRRRILAQIRERGPQMARDFERPEGHKSGWFERTPAKQMLEQMFMEGVLMTHTRQGFHKVYDLAERVLPAGVDTRFPSPKEMRRHLLLGFLRAHGLGRPEHFSYLRRAAHESIRAECGAMLKEGLLRQVRVEGLDKPFVHLSEDAGPQSSHEGVRLLSPFDNLLIQRKRTAELFGFDYTIECYVPAAKRKFGYFGLPVLLDGELVGQLDLKADREKGQLIVRAQQTRRLTALDKERLRIHLREFAEFNGCRRVSRSVTSGRAKLAGPEISGI